MQRRQESLDSSKLQQASKSNRLAPLKRSTTIGVSGGSLQDLKEQNPKQSSWRQQPAASKLPARISSKGRRMFPAGNAGLLLAQNQHISQLSIHSQSSSHQVDIFPDQQLARMFAFQSQPPASASASASASAPGCGSQIPPTKQPQASQQQQQHHHQHHHHQDTQQIQQQQQPPTSNLSSAQAVAGAAYSSAHRAGLDSSNSAISSEQLANDQLDRADRPSCWQIMRKLFFSLLLGLIIAVCWVLIIHTLKWIAIRGNEFASLTTNTMIAAEETTAAAAARHRSPISALDYPASGRSSRSAAAPAHLLLAATTSANQSSAQQQQQQQQQNRTQPSSQLLKLRQKPGQVKRNSDREESEEAENDDDQPNPQPSIVFEAGRQADDDHSSSSAEHKRARQQQQNRMRQKPQSTSTTTSTSTGASEPSLSEWPSPADDPLASAPNGGHGDADQSQQQQRSASSVGLAYRAPFFTSWFVSTWNILFMPVFTLISSCCFRNEDSNTKKLLVRESISQFMDNGLTTLQFLGRCAFFSVLWIGTIFGIVYSLYNLDATLVMALFACSATLVYLLSWVLLHQQFVGVRIVAVIICTTGIALLAYMDNSRTLGSVLIVAGSALCSAVYKVIYQRMFGFWSIAQMSLFFTLIGLFNAFLMWPIALLLYFLGVELIVWRYIPWMHLTAAGALHLSANILAYFGPICSYDIFLTLGLLFAVILSAAIDVNFYKITFAGMKLAGVLLLMIGFLVCLLPENWNEFLYDQVNERFIRWKKQRSMKKSRNKVQDMSTGQTSRLRTPSGRVK